MEETERILDVGQVESQFRIQICDIHVVNSPNNFLQFPLIPPHFLTPRRAARAGHRLQYVAIHSISASGTWPNRRLS